MNEVSLHRFGRLILVIFFICISFISLFYLSKLMYPFIIGFGIAFLINPVVNFLQYRLKFPRILAILISLLIIISFFAGLITLLVVEIISGANYLAKVVPTHLTTFIHFLENFFTAQIIPIYNQLTHLFSSLDASQQNTIIENIQNIGKSIGSSLGNFIQSFLEKIPTFFSWFPNAATVFIFSLLATFFISKDWQKMTHYFNRLLPKKAKTSTQVVLLDLKKAFFGFIKAQFTLISASTLIILIGLLVLKVNYAITIALIAGFVEIIPYLGTGLIFVPWIIYEWIIGDTSLAIGLGVIYIIVIVQRQIMEPKILSSNIGMDPLLTLISLFVGYQLLGFLGLIVGPVSLVILTTLHRANVFKDIWQYIIGPSK